MFQRFKRKRYVIDKISQTCKDFRHAAMAFFFYSFEKLPFCIHYPNSIAYKE